MRFCEFECDVLRIHELVDPDRFGEIAEESGFQPFFDIAGYGIGTERDHRDVRGRQVSSQDTQRLNTADALRRNLILCVNCEAIVIVAGFAHEGVRTRYSFAEFGDSYVNPDCRRSF